MERAIYVLKTLGLPKPVVHEVVGQLLIAATVDTNLANVSEAFTDVYDTPAGFLPHPADILHLQGVRWSTEFGLLQCYSLGPHQTLIYWANGPRHVPQVLHVSPNLVRKIISLGQASMVAANGQELQATRDDPTLVKIKAAGFAANVYLSTKGSSVVGLEVQSVMQRRYNLRPPVHGFINMQAALQQVLNCV